MRVLVITGDKSFKAGHPRYELQRSVVDELSVVCWGRGSLWPALPAGPFDVVTAQDPFWRGLFGWYVARKLGARFNVQVHTDLSAQPLVRRMLAQLVLSHANSVRVVSEKIKEQVLHIAPRAKVAVLAVFVDLPAFSSVVRRQHSGKNILWIGRFEEEKNPLEAIAVLEEVLMSVPDTQLTMLGTGSMTEKVIQKANNRPIIKILGWQNPVVHLDTADVVLCTSRHESFGVSIVESLAAGVPVVAPDVGVAREAGAVIVPRSDLGKKVAEVLRSSERGELRLTLPSKEEWAKLWRCSLEY